MKERWLSFVFQNDKQTAKKSVFFTEGGKHYAQDLQTRSQMVGQMQAMVRSLEQNVAIMLRETAQF